MKIINWYENYISNINQDLKNKNFDLNQNEEKVLIIIEIYKEAKKQNFEKVKELIIKLDCCDIENSDKTRDWNFWETSEDNIENFTSLESITAIFLDNLKNEVW